jgi:hypothetical protein
MIDAHDRLSLVMIADPKRCGLEVRKFEIFMGGCSDHHRN